MFWKSSFWKLLLSGFSEAKFVPLIEPLRILFYHIDQFPYSNWSRIIKSPSLLTFDAINIICVCLSHAFVAVSRLSVLFIIFLSIFSRPTLSVMLYSNNGVVLLECLLNAALNDVALLVFFKIIPYIFAFQVPFISSEVFYQLVQCSVLDLVPKTTDGLIVNFNWKKEEKKNNNWKLFSPGATSHQWWISHFKLSLESFPSYPALPQRACRITALWIYCNSLAALVYLNSLPLMLNSVSFIPSNIIFRFFWGHKNEAIHCSYIWQNLEDSSFLVKWILPILPDSWHHTLAGFKLKTIHRPAGSSVNANDIYYQTT